MDRQQAINTLNNPKSTKAALKHALSFALGVEYEPDTKEKRQTVFNRCQKVFCDIYTKETGLPYAFTGKDGKALTELIDKIKMLLHPPAEESIYMTFEHVINNLPGWYKLNAFSIPVINKKFNEIVSSIKNNGKGQQQSGISQSYKDRIRNGLRS